jgi:TPR repeat protein
MANNSSKSEKSRWDDLSVVAGYLIYGALIFWVGTCVFNSPEEEKKVPTAEELLDFEELKAKAESGDRMAQADLADEYWLGDRAVEKDYKEAAKWYRKSAEQGCGHAEAMLGLLYSDGDGVKQDHEKAERWYRKAANKGEDLAQFGLGTMYLLGEGVRKDKVTAYAWFKIAALNGSSQGNEVMSKMNEEYGRMTPAEFVKANALVKEMVDKDPNLIGRILRVEILRDLQIANPIEKDKAAKLAEELRDLKALAEFGHANAQHNLGMMYLKEHNEDQAQYWLLKAAEQGAAEAQFYLGWLKAVNATRFTNGVMTVDERIKKESFMWMYKAAEQGHGEGQHMVGHWYSKGIGVTEDKVTGLTWLSIARDNDWEESKETISALVETMTPAQIAKAEELVKEMVEKNPKLLK